MWPDLLALIFALLGPPLILLGGTACGVAALSLQTRGALWGLAGLVLLLVAGARGVPGAFAAIHLGPPSPISLLGGIYGALGVLLGGLVTARGQRSNEQVEEALALSWRRRFVIVITAAMVEEILYRGVGIGIGQELIGAPAAAALSVATFVLAHYRWRWSNFATVAMGGVVLSAVLLMTGDLWACILAHFVVNARSLFAQKQERSEPESGGEPRG